MMDEGRQFGAFDLVVFMVLVPALCLAIILCAVMAIGLVINLTALAPLFILRIWWLRILTPSTPDPRPANPQPEATT